MKSDLPQEVERFIEAHGRQLEEELDEALEALRQREAAGIPCFIHPYVNRTLAFDQAAYAACVESPTDVWTRLRKLVLAARIGAATPSYRDELRKILYELQAPIYGDKPIKYGYSLTSIREHLSNDDLDALAWEIWKQNPESVREVPEKTVWSDTEQKQGATKAVGQIFLFAEPSTDKLSELGLRLVRQWYGLAWDIGFTDVQAFQALRGWRRE